LIVDGRQPNYSEGVTLPELAQIAIDYGAYTALNLHGGGSSTWSSKIGWAVRKCSTRRFMPQCRGWKGR
jgi:exopolysaccharide biosynthesis protein